MDTRTDYRRATQVAIVCLFAIGFICAVANSVGGSLKDFWDAAFPWVSVGLAVALFAATNGPAKTH